MFAVDDIDDGVARRRTHGAELLGELMQYEHSYRPCYVRDSEGIIDALSEQRSLIGGGYGDGVPVIAPPTSCSQTLPVVVVGGPV